MQTEFLAIEHGKAVVRSRIPHLDVDTFRQSVLSLVGAGAKVVQYFAYPDGDELNLLAVLRQDLSLIHI